MWPFKRTPSKLNKASRSKEAPSEAAAYSPATLLVIQSDDYDWAKIFFGHTLQQEDGGQQRSIHVVQTGWEDILIHADTYSNDSRPIVEIRASSVGGSKTKVVRPDFVLIRNEVQTPNFDGRQLLSALRFADVPSINTLSSIHQFCDRASVMGYLHGLNRRLGDEVFPVVPQHFACGSRALMYGYTFPAVVKVGSAHAGAGKMSIIDHHQMSDFRSVLTMMPHEHCFVEPFIEGNADYRIQKIGSHYRAFRRRGISGEWKTNTGTAILEEIPLESRWKRWADEASKMFGGLDILTVDAIVEEKTGKEFILEVNGTSSGFHPDFAEEDNGHIRDLVLDRMNRKLRC